MATNHSPRDGDKSSGPRLCTRCGRESCSSPFDDEPLICMRCGRECCEECQHCTRCAYAEHHLAHAEAGEDWPRGR